MNIDKYHIIVLAFILFISGGIIWHLILSKVKSIIIKKRFKKGKSGEINAKKYLQEKGYKIIIEQPVLKSNIKIDNTNFSYQVRADFIAEKKGTQYLIEVKTGKEAADPLYSNTRRQLFEYYYLFNFDKLLLLNADTFEMKEIEFPNNKKNKIPILSFGIIILKGILLCILFLIILYLTRTFLL